MHAVLTKYNVEINPSQSQLGMFYCDDLKLAWQENIRPKRNRITMKTKLHLVRGGCDAVDKNSFTFAGECDDS